MPKQTQQESAEQHVMRFHDTMPGITERLYGFARTADGKLSYELLRDEGGVLTGKTVVDLACGNGPLTELLANAVGHTGSVWGIDLNKSELHLAQIRLNQTLQVTFLQESAHHLSLLSASVDAVFCHMAFMLFDPAEQVVSEIARILKPRGMFAAVLPSISESTPSFKFITETLAVQVQQESSPQTCRIGNSITSTREGLQTLFSREMGFENDLLITHFTILLRDTPEELPDRIFPLFYAGSFLSQQGTKNVKTQWKQYFQQNVDLDGQTVLAFPQSLIRIHRS